MPLGAALVLSDPDPGSWTFVVLDARLADASLERAVPGARACRGLHTGRTRASDSRVFGWHDFR